MIRRAFLREELIEVPRNHPFMKRLVRSIGKDGNVENCYDLLSEAELEEKEAAERIGRELANRLQIAGSDIQVEDTDGQHAHLDRWGRFYEISLFSRRAVERIRNERR
jgi:hypothetical protein